MGGLDTGGRGDNVTGIHVLLVDDRELLRDAVRALLARHPDIEVIGQAESGADCIDLSSRLHPEVIVLNLKSASETAWTVGAVRGRETNPRVLAVVGNTEAGQLARIVRAGASGCMSVRWGGDELVEAIRAIHRGVAYFDPTVLQSLLGDAENSPSRPEQAAGELRIEQLLSRAESRVPCPASGDSRAPCRRAGRVRPLSTPERQAVRLFADGKSTDEAAGAMGVSRESLETLRIHAMDKLQVRNRARLVRYAMRRGLRFE